MKRDMELIRLILLDTEGETEVDLSPYSHEQLSYHKKLLYERGLAKGTVHSSISGANYELHSLTWEGHDFLDAARDDKVWQETMRQVSKSVGTTSLEVIKAVLVSVATQMITRGQP